LKILAPALTGGKLNAPGLTRFEKLAHTVVPADAFSQSAKGGWLAFLTVLTEKMNSRDETDLLRKFQLPRKEMDGLRKLPSRAKKLETALKSARITKPSHVYDALKDATSDEVLMVLYESAQRVVQDRIRAYYQKYLPLAQEVTEEQVAATGLKPGTPKFEKAFRDMVTSHLNARPKKIPPPEPEVIAAPPAPMMARSGAARK
jgi:hypothetical protein